eukprot:8514210-Pyramimonas_sp.AAC.1
MEAVAQRARWLAGWGAGSQPLSDADGDARKSQNGCGYGAAPIISQIVLMSIPLIHAHRSHPHHLPSLILIIFSLVCKI